MNIQKAQQIADNNNMSVTQDGEIVSLHHKQVTQLNREYSTFDFSRLTEEVFVDTVNTGRGFGELLSQKCNDCGNANMECGC